MFIKRSKLRLISEIKYSEFDPIITVIVPIFNKQAVIVKNLQALIQSMEAPFELFLIDDASEDSSRELVSSWLETLIHPPRNLVSHKFFGYARQQFETKCDAIGIENARARFILEVQADIEIIEHGFDTRMLTAMNQRPFLVAISGRGCHDLNLVAHAYIESMGAATSENTKLLEFLLRLPRNLIKAILMDFKMWNPQSRGKPASFKSVDKLIKEIFPDQSVFEISKRAGLLGSYAELGIEIPHEFTHTMWVSETVMRGPLLLDVNKYHEVGGFDTKRYFLGYDDHDFFLRATELGYRCGYVPVAYKSPLEAGSTRAHRSFSTQIVFALKLLRRWHLRKTSPLYQFGKSQLLKHELPAEVIKF